MPLTTSTVGSDSDGGPVDTGSHRDLELRLGHRFSDPALLELALRHRSWCAENGGVLSNERLEFLGDAVLGVIVTDCLYRAQPERAEGVLARCRAELVNAVALASVAREIDLGASIRLGRGENQTGGRNKTSILADALEALIGAVHIDGGIVAATTVVDRLFAGRIESVLFGAIDSDSKSRLQELAARLGGDPPRYRITEEGPEHAKVFTAEVEVAGASGCGRGRTKKEAEQAAARNAATALLARGEASDDQTGSGPLGATRSTSPVDHAQPGGPHA